MTIVERALAYRDDVRNGKHGIYNTITDAYYVGATEQHKIDIEKACEVYRKELLEIIETLNKVGKQLYNVDELGELISLDGCVKDFRKAMEE